MNDRQQKKMEPEDGLVEMDKTSGAVVISEEEDLGGSNGSEDETRN